jgi:hypothetical protein
MPHILPLATMVIASLLAMPLVVGLGTAADARDAGLDAPAATIMAAGIAIAVLYPLAGLVVLVRPALAALLFLLAAALGFFFGYEDGQEGLAVYGILALPLAAVSALCARWRRVPWVANGRGG